jgi:hypothetical protein
MPKKPEENATKPTHGSKPEKGFGHLKRPGAVKPGEQNPEADKPTPVITHKHERKETVERDCTQCEYAVQVSDNEWECSAETYFPASKICFKARKGRKE